MRILNVTATYSPSKNGVAMVVSSSKKELEKLGNEVYVLAPENKKRTSNETGIICYPSIPNTKVEDYPIPLLPDLRTITKLLGGNKPVIVHTHHPFHVGFFSRLIANYYKVPLVFTFHTRYETYSENYLKFLPSNLKKMFIQNDVNEFCKKTDLIISPSASITKDLLKDNPYLNVVTIPSGLCAIPKAEGSVVDIRKKLNISENKKVLLTVTRLSEEKNLPLLLESVRLLDGSYILLLVGGGPCESELKQLAEDYGILEKIRFVGAVEHDKLGIYYQAADTFVYPSITETQGLIFLEALSFGLPIVAINSCASGEWVSKDLGLLTANNPKAFVSGILEISKWNRDNVASKAKEIVGNYSIEESTKLLVTEYEKVIERFRLGKKFIA